MEAELSVGVFQTLQVSVEKTNVSNTEVELQ